MTAQSACCRFGGGTNCEGDVTLETVTQKVENKDAIVNYKCVSKNVNLFEGNGCAGKITKTYEKKSNFHYYQCEEYTIDCSSKKTLSNDGLNPAPAKIITYSDTDEWVDVETTKGVFVTSKSFVQNL
jgi:hypothetical protein